jgi:hypothetical protein
MSVASSVTDQPEPLHSGAAYWPSAVVEASSLPSTVIVHVTGPASPPPLRSAMSTSGFRCGAAAFGSAPAPAAQTRSSAGTPKPRPASPSHTFTGAGWHRCKTSSLTRHGPAQANWPVVVRATAATPEVTRPTRPPARRDVQVRCPESRPPPAADPSRSTETVASPSDC